MQSMKFPLSNKRNSLGIGIGRGSGPDHFAEAVRSHPMSVLASHMSIMFITSLLLETYQNGGRRVAETQSGMKACSACSGREAKFNPQIVGPLNGPPSLAYLLRLSIRTQIKEIEFVKV